MATEAIATKYTLEVTETGKKAGKFLYTVKDEAGNVISTRTSNREYVACTIFGTYYFGRLDLIGKGEHGRMLKFWASVNRGEVPHTSPSVDSLAKLDGIQLIAYKK